MSTGRFIVFLVAAVIVATIAIRWVQPWKEADESWGDGVRPKYLAFCPDKNPPGTDRYRLCPNFFQKAFKPDQFPDAAIFLRKRLDDLIPSYERAAWSAFTKYQFFTYGILVAGFLAFAGAALIPALVSKAALFTAIGMTLLATLTAFGFNAQFRTNFSAYRELTSLRDQIELELVQAAQAGGTVSPEFNAAAFASYKEIVNTHAKSFGSSFSNPSLIGPR